MECIICLSYEKNKYSKLASQNKTTYLSKIYECKCTGNAHLKCLKNISRCPTCRKIISKLNL